MKEFVAAHILPEGADVVAFLTKGAEQHEPELFSKFYPRIYSELASYYSPKTIAAFLTDAVASSREVISAAVLDKHARNESLDFDAVNLLTQAHRMMLPGLQYMIDRKMPLMFLAPQLVEAVKLTNFPDEIDWKDMALPYEHGIFVLPKGALTHPKDGDVACILYSRMRPGDYKPPHKIFPTFHAVKTSMCMVALCPIAAMWYDANLTDDDRSVLKIRNLFYGHGAEYAKGPSLGKPTMLDHHLNEEDSIFLEDIAVVLFGTLLAMNARPDLLIPAKLEKAVQKPGKPRKEFWSPNIIGKYYTLPRQKGIPVGIHASPRMHWRRGHFRQQVFGAGRSQRKTIWLEPMLVGLKEEEK